jgi:hypothetical protein
MALSTPACQSLPLPIRRAHTHATHLQHIRTHHHAPARECGHHSDERGNCGASAASGSNLRDVLVGPLVAGRCAGGCQLLRCLRGGEVGRKAKHCLFFGKAGQHASRVESQLNSVMQLVGEGAGEGGLGKLRRAKLSRD